MTLDQAYQAGYREALRRVRCVGSMATSPEVVTGVGQVSNIVASTAHDRPPLDERRRTQSAPGRYEPTAETPTVEGPSA